MRILLLAHSSFATYFVVGSNQLARQFSLQGHEIYHVSSPVSPLNVFKKDSGFKKLKVALFQKHLVDDHWLVKDHIPFVPFPMGYSKSLDRINAFFVKRYIDSLTKDKFDLVLIDQPLFHPVLKYFDSSTIIYRPTDIYGEMGGARYDCAEAQVLKYTDSVAATNANILDAILRKYNVTRSIVLNNGVDAEFFNGFLKANSKRSGVMYVGAIDFRFDLDFVINLSRANPTIQFDIYGPLSIELPIVLPENLNFKGAVGYLELPELMHRYRYGLMPFNNHPSNKGRSPMKLWEYHAAGLKIIAKMYFQDFMRDISDAIYVDLNDSGTDIVIEEKFYELKAVEKVLLPSWKKTANMLLRFATGFGDHLTLRCDSRK